LSFLFLATALRTSAQATSTPEERVQWVETTHKLESSPLDDSVNKQGDAALKRLSEVHDIHHVERGYEDLPGKLRALGAEVDASGWGDAAMPGSPWGREEQESPWGREEVNVPEAPSYHPR